MTILYQGAAGAFGHEACLTFAPGEVARALASFAAVAAGVAAGEAEFGMLPLENSRAGKVPGVEALIAEGGLRIVSRHTLPIRMHLLGLPVSRLEALRTVVSHPIALAQCRRSIKRLRLATEEAPNTALAARDLADPSRAALASEACATLYGRQLLLRDLQDDPDNSTLFALVAA